MAKKEVITPAGFSASATPLSPGIKVGNTVYVSGQVGRHPTTGQMGSDIREQTRNCLERIKAILEAAGGSFDDIVKTVDYIVTTEGYTGTANVRREYFRHGFPAATGIVVKELLRSDALIEIDAIAVLEEKH